MFPFAGLVCQNEQFPIQSNILLQLYQNTLFYNMLDKIIHRSPKSPPPLPPQIPGVISLFPPEEGGLRLIKLISLWEGGTFWCFHYSITSSPPLHKARNTNDLFYARVNCQTAGIKNHRSGKTLRTYIEGGENISL